MEKLRLYLNGLTAEQKSAFERKIKSTIGYLRKAITEGQLINPVTCVLIEKHSNGVVSRKDLHPDDWKDIWPELAKKAA